MKTKTTKSTKKSNAQTEKAAREARAALAKKTGRAVAGNVAKAKTLGITFGQKVDNPEHPLIHGKTFYAERPKDKDLPEGAKVKTILKINDVKFEPVIYRVDVVASKAIQSTASAKASKAKAKRATASNGKIPKWKQSVLERESTKEIVAKISKATSAKPVRGTSLDAKYELRLAKIAASCGVVQMETRDDVVVFFGN